MRVRKDSRIHSFGHLDVDVWTLRRFRKSKEENNINSLHFLFLPYFPTKKKNFCLTSKRPRPNVHFPCLQKKARKLYFFSTNVWDYQFLYLSLQNNNLNPIEQFVLLNTTIRL